MIVLMKQRLTPNVALYRPRPHALLATIRSLATDTRRIGFSTHALDRMDERGITTIDVIRVLQCGEIIGEIEPGRRPGEWKCKVVERRRRAREIGIATIIFREERLFVKTAEWEDL